MIFRCKSDVSIYWYCWHVWCHIQIWVRPTFILFESTHLAKVLIRFDSWLKRLPRTLILIQLTTQAASENNDSPSTHDSSDSRNIDSDSTHDSSGFRKHWFRFNSWVKRFPKTLIRINSWLRRLSQELIAIQLMTLAASENINLNQLMIQVASPGN